MKIFRKLHKKGLFRHGRPKGALPFKAGFRTVEGEGALQRNPFGARHRSNRKVAYSSPIAGRLWAGCRIDSLPKENLHTGANRRKQAQTGANRRKQVRTGAKERPAEPAQAGASGASHFAAASQQRGGLNRHPAGWEAWQCCFRQPAWSAPGQIPSGLPQRGARSEGRPRQCTGRRTGRRAAAHRYPKCRREDGSEGSR